MPRALQANLEQEIYDYIKQRWEDADVPTVREIQVALGIKSTSTVHKYLKLLESDGLIEIRKNLNRSIRLIEGGERMHKIPLLGAVAAGLPITAQQDIEEYLPFKGQYASEDLFALRVKGESMIGAGILDGDVIVVYQTPVVRNGEIAVVMTPENEATVKRFYRENNEFRLHSENPDFPDFHYKEVDVLGRVISVMRFYE